MKLVRIAMFAGVLLVLHLLFRAAPAALTTPSTTLNYFHFAVGVAGCWFALGMLLAAAVLPYARNMRRRATPRTVTGPAATSALCNGCGHRVSVHYCLTHKHFLCELCAGIGHLDCKFTDYAHGAALRRAEVKANDYKASQTAAQAKAAGN